MQAKHTSTETCTKVHAHPNFNGAIKSTSSTRRQDRDRIKTEYPATFIILILLIPFLWGQAGELDADCTENLTQAAVCSMGCCKYPAGSLNKQYPYA